MKPNDNNNDVYMSDFDGIQNKGVVQLGVSTASK